MSSTNTESFNISLISNPQGLGSVLIDWSFYEYRDKVFKVYRSNDNQEFETISIDYTTVKEVKCLHVYPESSLENQLRSWMSSIGQNIIQVYPVYIDDFNQNPSYYLKNNEKWKYDVIFFGSYDINNKKDLCAESAALVKEFINNGKGVIFGHDTLMRYKEINYNAIYFNSFADVVGVKVGLHTESSFRTGSQVYIAKTGLLTSYPFNLPIGTTFIVPTTHVSAQEVINLDNVNFFIITDYLYSKPNLSYYLTTKNNVGFIQTGHTSGEATDDEKKIICNLIFYCNQLLIGQCNMSDYGAIDKNPPNSPQIKGTYRYFYISATDEPTTYYYFVESYDKDDTSQSGLICRSQNASQTVSTGIKHYIYLFDNSTDTNVTKENGIITESTMIIGNYRSGYLHVAAVDGSDNIGPTSTAMIMWIKPTYKKKYQYRKQLFVYILLHYKTYSIH